MARQSSRSRAFRLALMVFGAATLTGSLVGCGSDGGADPEVDAGPAAQGNGNSTDGPRAPAPDPVDASVPPAVDAPPPVYNPSEPCLSIDADGPSEGNGWTVASRRDVVCFSKQICRNGAGCNPLAAFTDANVSLWLEAQGDTTWTPWQGAAISIDEASGPALVNRSGKGFALEQCARSTPGQSTDSPYASCGSAGDFSYFMTRLHLPTDFAVESVDIQIDALDDALRVGVGEEPNADFLSYKLGTQHTKNLADKLTGRSTSLMLTHMDDCPEHRILKNAIVRVNKTPVRVCE